ncbi:MAG TPA: hypothetical protein VFF52_02460 [Isosphaeraceae bacterium]|nr:hypothetical protein [Isosphaeraceae bacterium]
MAEGMGGWRGELRRSAAMACVVALGIRCGTPLTAGQPATSLVLGEAMRRGSTARVWIELKGQGLFRPGLPPGPVAAAARMPKPLALDVQTRLVYSERVLELVEDAVPGARRAVDAGSSTGPPAGASGRARKVVRHVLQAASAINGEVRPTSAAIRPEVGLLVAERRDRDEPVVVVSPAGPLTRSELELVQTVGDPLALADLLPGAPVRLGEHWRVGERAAQAVSGYDVLTTNALDATLESLDDTRARVRLKGRVEGTALGGAGLMNCEGFLTFDRRMGWIDRLELNRAETRRPGPIEAGLDVKSTLSMTRQAERPPATLTDAGLAGIPLEITPLSLRLLLVAPDGKSSLLHDRHWHAFWDDPKRIVLKRLEGSQVVAQCNIAVGPAAGKGRHQDPAQFRDDIRRALRHRFVQFLGAGEVDGDPAGGFRYKVGVQGREGDLGIVWYYYLVASPAGDQLLVTFTLSEESARGFGDQDAEMIGSLRWSAASRGTNPQ